MFAAISGLRGNQVYMDAIGNNIANINTTAYKSARSTFSATLSQLMRPASAPQGGRGGINPAQVGLGSSLASIDTVFSQGDLKSTGRITDLAIQGEGFFILSDGLQRVYTRDGAFDLGTDGTLLNASTGFKVQGWMADPITGIIDPATALTQLTVPVGGRANPAPTTSVIFGGNLDARLAAYNPGPPASGGITTSTMEIYDSLGGTHVITLTFTKQAAPRTWNWTATGDASIGTITGSGTLVFNVDGTLNPALCTPPGGIGNITINNWAAGIDAAFPQVIDTVDLRQITSAASTSEVTLTEKNGTSPGTFVTFAIDRSGIMTGLYSNGTRKTIGQIALASFRNPGGLLKASNNAYEASTNSGEALVAAPGTNGLGDVNSGYLESANVDLAQQFTDIITASRGFQANSRVITTADEMLQELVNLKR